MNMNMYLFKHSYEEAKTLCVKLNRIVIAVVVAVIYSFCFFKDSRKLHIIFFELSKVGLSLHRERILYMHIHF